MRAVEVLRVGWMVAALAASLGACGSDSDDPAGAAGAPSGGSGGGNAGGSGPGGSNPGGAGGSGGSGGGGAQKCDKSGDLDLSGTWLIKARLEVVMTSLEGALVQVCPIDQTGPADLLLLGRFEQSGAELTSMSVTICDFSLPEVTAIVGKCTDDALGEVRSRVSPSAALRDALPTLVVPKAKGKLGGTTDGASFSPDRLTFALGSESLTGPMAIWKGGPVCDDPKSPLGTGEGCEEQCVSPCSDVIDSDGDKLPGVTMGVCGFAKDELQGTKCNTDAPEEAGVTLQGKAGINFRVDPLLTGAAENSCTIRGKVDAEIDYNVLGANLRLSGGILSVKAVREAIPAFDVVADKSQFVAFRVDGKYGTPDLGISADNPKAACKAAIDNQNNFLN